MLAEHEVAQLREAFQKADYRADAVLDRIGDAGQSGLGRNSTFPAALALADDHDATATLVKTFILQQHVAADELDLALGPCADAMRREGVIASDGSLARACIDIRPYGSADDHASGWVASDLTPGLDGVTQPTRPDYVLGVSPASTTLAQLTVRRPVDSALDLGVGCGVQSLHLTRHAARVVATDVNPRALEMAALTTGLNEVDVSLRAGSLYEPVANDLFDLIVSNPPYVMSPPRPADTRLRYREAGLPADRVVERVVTEGPRHLTPGGTLQVLANWAVLRDEAWDDRLAGWVEPSGCDALILERERLDPYEYIEIWLTDAGLAGSPEYPRRYRQWVDYFDRLGIVAVGLGWISLHNAGRERPHVQIEAWPHAVQQPVGPAFAAQQDGVALAALPDQAILARRWTLAPDVVQETLGVPGQEHPDHIVLRQQTGFRRAVEVDTALAGAVGACDGELTLADVLGALAQILDEEVGAVASAILPRVRQLAVDGLLT